VCNNSKSKSHVFGFERKRKNAKKRMHSFRDQPDTADARVWHMVRVTLGKLGTELPNLTYIALITQSKVVNSFTRTED